MSKVNSVAGKLRSIIQEHPDDFTTDGKKLFCVVCETSIVFDKSSQIKQHLKTAKHTKSKIARSNQKAKTQQMLTTSFSSSSSNETNNSFYADLNELMLSINIPYHKLSHPNFKKFIENYTGRPCPHESTLRKTYLNRSYERVIENIREAIGQSIVLVSIDETTDVEGRYVASVIVGKLESGQKGRSFLLTMEQLEKTNHETIARLFNDSMALLWPGKVLHENVLLLISDAAPYMIKAGSCLRIFYPKMIHITCIVHGLHRVCETIRANFKNVDKIISNGKKVFLKAPSRVARLRELYPNIPLPPSPILTRWGTWIKAAIYYTENLDKIKAVVNEFDSEEASSIREMKATFSSQLNCDLAFIASKYKILIDAIEILQSSSISLKNSISSINDIKTFLEDRNEQIALKKLNDVLRKNPGWNTMNEINDTLNKGAVSESHSLSPEDIIHLEFAPMTSAEVERSFSKLKYVLADNRRSFTFDNLKKTLVVNVFYNE